METDISYQGHGAQRSLIFALIEAVAKHNSNGGQPQGQTKSTILLFEEPELFLHPHLIRRLQVCPGLNFCSGSLAGHCIYSFSCNDRYC
ncbi:MAG: AAA family ATPase [Fibrobacterota bacterium]|nr:MAG: AAA family ATPase [Fibrobacterota bacterium]